MDRKVAKEFLHLRDWLDKAADIASRGEGTDDSAGLLQDAGDSMMMKLGEAPGRLARGILRKKVEHISDQAQRAKIGQIGDASQTAE